MGKKSRQANRKNLKLERMFQAAYGSEDGIVKNPSKEELKVRDQVFAALYANRKNIHV